MWKLRQAGAQIESIDLPETGRAGAGAGQPAAAEAYARHRLGAGPACRAIRPGAQRIEAPAMSAADYIHLQHARQASAWISRMEAGCRL